MKNIWKLPLTFTSQTLYVMMRVRLAERRAPAQVVQAASRAASLAWGIDPSRFRPDLDLGTMAVQPFAPLRRTTSIRAALFNAGAVGWGGVVRDEAGNLCVRAIARNGYFLTKELVKGTAELICLHGLGQLDDSSYEQVMRATDRVELEPAMLQSGGELWRRLLHTLPQTTHPAEVLMRLAQSPNDVIVDLLQRVIEETAGVSDRIRALCDADLV